MTVTKSKNVQYNDSVTWSVSAPGFATQTGIIDHLNEDTTINVKLLVSIEHIAAGTYTDTLTAGTYDIIVVGGGAGGAFALDTGNKYIGGGSGGSGACYIARVVLSAGTYTCVVGNGSAASNNSATAPNLRYREVSAGGSSTFSGNGINISVPGGEAWSFYQTNGGYGPGGYAFYITTSGFTPISESKLYGNNGVKAPTTTRPYASGNGAGGVSSYTGSTYGKGGDVSWTYSTSYTYNYSGSGRSGQAGAIIIREVESE